MVYKGHGGPPPSAARAKGASPKGFAPYSFGLYEPLPNGKRKKVALFRVNPGDKAIPFVFLDEALPSAEHNPSIRIHRDFRYRGSYGNSVICIAHRSTGCPMDRALEQVHRCFPNCPDDCDRRGKKVPIRGSWRWVASGIKIAPFTFSRGPNKGKTLEHQRCLLLVPEAQYSTFVAYRDTFAESGGLRGRVFHVSRDDDKRSSKIGTAWIPHSEMTDEQMMEEFEESASMYGLPVEKYIQPFNYEEVLAELSDEEMMSAAKYVAAEKGVSLDGSTGSDDQGNDGDSASDGDDGASDEDEIPF